MRFIIENINWVMAIILSMVAAFFVGLVVFVAVPKGNWMGGTVTFLYAIFLALGAWLFVRIETQR